MARIEYPGSGSEITWPQGNVHNIFSNPTADGNIQYKETDCQPLKLSETETKRKKQSVKDLSGQENAYNGKDSNDKLKRLANSSGKKSTNLVANNAYNPLLASMLPGFSASSITPTHLNLDSVQNIPWNPFEYIQKDSAFSQSVTPNFPSVLPYSNTPIRSYSQLLPPTYPVAGLPPVSLGASSSSAYSPYTYPSTSLSSYFQQNYLGSMDPFRVSYSPDALNSSPHFSRSISPPIRNAQLSTTEFSSQHNHTVLENKNIEQTTASTVATTSTSQGYASGSSGGSESSASNLEEFSGTEYTARRKRNNDAAKKSRDARRLKGRETAMRAAVLALENAELKNQKILWENKVAELRNIYSQTLKQRAENARSIT